MTCSKCGEQPKVMFDGVCFTCWQKHHDAGLKAELAEVKAFAAKLSEELDRANATINRLDNLVLEQNKRIKELEETFGRLIPDKGL